MLAPGSGWTLLPASMSVYHDNGKGAAEQVRAGCAAADPPSSDRTVVVLQKFIHSDGREAVVDGDTGKIYLDPRYMPTYNYVRDPHCLCVALLPSLLTSTHSLVSPMSTSDVSGAGPKS